MVTLSHIRIVVVGMFILLALAALAPTARADIAIDTFGAGDTYNTTSYYSFGGLGSSGRFAARFVPASAAAIDRVSAAMAYATAGSTTVTLSISADVSGAPGSTPIWTSNTLTVSTLGIYVFTGPSIALSAGQTYWVSAYAPSSPATTTRWQLGSSGASGSIATGSSTWQVTASQTLPAFRVESVPVTGACCSTATGGCSVLAGATCTLLGLRFDGAGSTCGAIPCHMCPGDFNHSGTITAQDIFDFLNAWFAGCA